MKKTFLISVSVCAIIFSCKSNNEDGTTPGEKKTFKRNASINASNACNNIFLDSSALENFITAQKIDNDVADQLRGFYYDRNFEYAWFAPDGLTEQGREFWNLYTYSVSSLKDSAFFNKALNKRMPNITSEDSLTVSATDSSIAKTELMQSEAFIRYTMKDGDKDSKEQLRQYVPAKKDDVMHAAGAILSSDGNDSQNADAGNAFKALKEQLKKYYAIAKKGGWQPIPLTGKKYKLGVTAPVVQVVKKRLQITGELDGADTTTVFDALLDSAVKNFQTSLGYTPNGVITDSLIKDMNVSAEKRTEQLLINLNRLRWMPEYAQGRLIVVNIPEYELHVYENKQKAFDMDIVVGKEGAGTVIFTGNLTEIVFSPYWNIPPSIIKNEIVPKMDANKNYLAEQNMEITGESGGLPVVRQLPGPKNSLGRVKFLFHNSYNIYFHDTPAKELFNKDKRAYSHGCIRLADPAKMANYLLDDSQKWTADKINEAMNSTTEKYVTLKNSVPVIITYYTAWVDGTGRLNFRDDIYAHDASVAEKMFTNPQ